MMSKEDVQRVQTTHEIFKMIMDNAMHDINTRYGKDYVKRHSNIVAAAVNLQKSIYLSLVESYQNRDINK